MIVPGDIYMKVAFVDIDRDFSTFYLHRSKTGCMKGIWPASWLILTLLGFWAILATLFQAAVSFGILVSSAIVMGIFGDRIFIKSTILTFLRIKRIVLKVAQKENFRSGYLERPL
jgi:hypothetical protein